MVKLCEHVITCCYFQAKHLFFGGLGFDPTHCLRRRREKTGDEEIHQIEVPVAPKATGEWFSCFRFLMRRGR